MSNTETTAIDFSHRINSDFYESMLDVMNRIAGIANVVAVANRLDDGGLSRDSTPAAAHAIQMEANDAIKMLEAWQKSRFE
ncbi:hypothetical protein [Methylomonas sp. UP202]|uniref:hypothetical protein n=1 Tax=Methylomonas sp. UP202 TaxID=3040943 RepID=UPI0024790025|nr:hypothetical protein [Methylomonas sp. UP202]WGS84317.1 hypothetical protein QC632_14800 [Methylomonas sp. UP202]WGS86633.1 hypothetical protein QC632_02480 [Methylomonas sp. UP202]